MKRLTAVLKRKKAARNSRSRSRDRKKKRRKKSESTEESGQESEGEEAVKGSGSEQEAEVLGFFGAFIDVFSPWKDVKLSLRVINIFYILNSKLFVLDTYDFLLIHTLI